MINDWRRRAQLWIADRCDKSGGTKTNDSPPHLFHSWTWIGTRKSYNVAVYINDQCSSYIVVIIWLMAKSHADNEGLWVFVIPEMSPESGI
jgi:hypothetical protein